MSKKILHSILLAVTMVLSQNVVADTSAQKLVDSDISVQIHTLHPTMSVSEIISFFTKREQFLALTEKALLANQGAIGRIMVFKTKRNYQNLLKEKDKLEADAYSYNESMKQDILVNLYAQQEQFKNDYDLQSQKPREELAKEVIANILKALDQKMIQQAPIISHSNEFGVLGAVGLMAEYGNPEKGRGGLADIGISLGFNWEQKAVAFQIFNDIEKYKTTLMPAVLIAGVVGKFGVYVSNERQQLQTKGTSFYPAVVPGFTSSTPSSFMTGASSGLTWPPSPLGDVLTYENTLNKNVLLRVMISPMKKRFIDVKSLLPKNYLDFFALPMKKFFSVNQKSCESLFLK